MTQESTTTIVKKILSEMKDYPDDFNANMRRWIDDGNAVEIRKGVYVEQTTQWKKHFTWEELKEFFYNEYIKD